jgi:hypothetical protein
MILSSDTLPAKYLTLPVATHTVIRESVAGILGRSDNSAGVAGLAAAAFARLGDAGFQYGADFIGRHTAIEHVFLELEADMARSALINHYVQTGAGDPK